ncbi:MAG: hypothetical protein ACYDH6_19245 [Acidimicrobiales bacterium]
MHDRAIEQLSGIGRSGYMEVTVTLRQGGVWSQSDLLAALRESQIQTFGWPIAPIVERDPLRPVPTADGVRAELLFQEGDGFLGVSQYDLWMVRRDAAIYAFSDLFEDERSTEKVIYFNTRIVRVTEAVLLAARMYSRLGVPEGTPVTIEVRHGGLAGRQFSGVGGRHIFPGRISHEDEIRASAARQVRALETDLVAIVKELLAPLFVLFDFAEIPDGIWEEIVNDFVAGKVT